MKCGYNKPWQGICGKECRDSFCAEHLECKCSICGEQATLGCDQTSGLVCGAHLCESSLCRAKHDFAQHRISMLDTLGFEIMLLRNTRFKDSLSRDDLLEASDYLRDNVYANIELYQEHLPENMDKYKPSLVADYVSYKILNKFIELDQYFSEIGIQKVFYCRNESSSSRLDTVFLNDAENENKFTAVVHRINKFLVDPSKTDKHSDVLGFNREVTSIKLNIQPSEVAELVYVLGRDILNEKEAKAKFPTLTSAEFKFLKTGNF